jgi:hypothetical protein
MSFMTTIRPMLDRALRLPLSLGRTGRMPLALSALLLTASSMSVIATTNAPPVFTSLVLSKSVVYEGEPVTLTGAFTDPNAGDRHTVLVYWYGDGSDELQHLKQKILLPAGQSTFQVSHTYGDSVPGRSIRVVIFDHELPAGSNDNASGMLWDAELLPITVINVAPRLPEPITVTQSRVSPTQIKVKIDGAIADGAGDTHQVRAARWYGSTVSKVTTPCAADKLRYHCELTYAYAELGSSQTVTLYVKDDEGAQGAANISVPGRDDPDA